MIRTILVPMAGQSPVEPALDAALATARIIDADIRTLFIQPDPATALGYTAEIPLAGRSPEAIIREMGEIAGGARDEFRAWQRANHVPPAGCKPREGVSASWSNQVGSIESMVTRFGRLVDMIVTNRPTNNGLLTRHCFDAAVFGTGRPTLVVDGPLPKGFGESILIAWNGSLEASRALAGAMPLLDRAHRVSILSAHDYDDEAVDLTDLAEALSARGIHTPEVLFSAKRASAGAQLIAAAESQGASLIVMGAYTHSRLRESVLGGVTRHLLAHAPAPLLMCH
jgi:nucleotide-binding universal stress UspA family protein